MPSRGAHNVPCPVCKDRNAIVTDSRLRPHHRLGMCKYRRRWCDRCLHKFSTVEVDAIALDRAINFPMKIQDIVDKLRTALSDIDKLPD